MPTQPLSLHRPIGHDGVLANLFDRLGRDRLPHALLFNGPEGIGKGLAARWLAAGALCQKAGGNPCLACAACIQVGACSHPDLVLVERVSSKKEIGVDAIRQVKHFVQLQAVSGSRKIAVVEEAERLTIAAQNALLKTLEEPPGHALIILVTPSTEALLPTVRSRCQRVRFEPLDTEQVAIVLQNVCGLEEDEACLLAASADGSPGRALRLRELVTGTGWKELLGALADLHPAHYCSVARVAGALGRTEQEMTTRLDLLLHTYRDAAVNAVTGNRTHSRPAGGVCAADPEAAVRTAEAVAHALRTLRRRNPNRPLLAEALALRLARS
jgi:DNA polymerase III subunit delta'